MKLHCFRVIGHQKVGPLGYKRRRIPYGIKLLCGHGWCVMELRKYTSLGGRMVICGVAIKWTPPEKEWIQGPHGSLVPHDPEVLRRCGGI